MSTSIVIKSLVGKWNVVGYFGVSISYLSDTFGDDWITTLTKIGGLVLVVMSIYKMSIEIKNAKMKNKKSLK